MLENGAIERALAPRTLLWWFDPKHAEQQDQIDAGAFQPRLQGIAPHHLDILQAGFANFLAHPFGEIGQRLQRDKAPALADHPGGGQRKKPGAAPDLKNRLPARNSGAPERSPRR